jgi:acyl-CoA thioesterase
VTPEPASTCQFDRDLALEEESLPSSLESTIRRFQGTFSDRWLIDRGLHGGHSIAAMVRAIEAAAGNETRTLRSLTNHYLLPVSAGPFAIDVTIERAGRSLSNVSARLVQEGRVVGLALAALGEPRESYEWDHSAMPFVAPPDGCPDLWDGITAPSVQKNWESRVAIGPRYGSGKLFDTSRTETVSGGWIRLRDPRPVDAAVAAALTDTWLPTPFTYLDDEHPALFPTVELTVQFLDPLPLPGDTGELPCFVLHRIDTARSGFLVQDTDVWTRDGRMIARGRQHALLIPVR